MEHNQSNDAHIRMLPLGAALPGFNKLKKLKPGHLLVAKRHNHITAPWTNDTYTNARQIEPSSGPQSSGQEENCLRRWELHLS